MEGTSLDHHSVASVSLVEERGKGVVTMEAQNTGEPMPAVAEETKDALKTASFVLGKTEMAGATIGLKPKKRKKKKKGQNKNKDTTVEAQSTVESKLAVAEETKDTQNTASFVLEKDNMPVGVSTDMNSKKRKRKGRSSNTDATVDAQNTVESMSAVPEEIKAPNIASSALEKDEGDGAPKKRKRGRSGKKAVTVEVQKSMESTLAVPEETKDTLKIDSSVVGKDEMARVPTEINSKKRKKKGRSKNKVVTVEALNTVESMLAAHEETKDRPEIVSSVLDKDKMAGQSTDLNSKKSKRKGRSRKKAATLEAQDTVKSALAVPGVTKDPPKIASSSLEKAEIAGVPINLNSKKRKRKGQSGQKVMIMEAQNTMESTLFVPEETKNIPKIASSVLEKDLMAGGLTDLNSKKRKKKKRPKKKVVNVEALNTAESMLAVPKETKDTPKIVSSVLDKDEKAKLPIDLKSKKSRRKARKKAVAVEALNTVDSTVAVPEETKDTPKVASSLLDKDEMGGVPITLNSKKRKRKERSTKKAMTVEAQNTLESTLAVPEETKEMPNIASSVLEKDEMAGVPIDTNSKKRKKKGQSEKKVVTVEDPNTVESTLIGPEGAKETPKIVSSVLDKDEMVGPPVDLNSKKSSRKGRSREKTVAVEAQDTAVSTLAVPEDTKDTLITSTMLEKDETAAIDSNSKKRKRGQSVKTDATMEAQNTVDAVSAVTEETKETLETTSFGSEKSEAGEVTTDLNSKKTKRIKSTLEVVTDTSSQKSPIGYIGGALNHQSVPSVSLIRDDKSTMKPKTDVSSPKANEHTVEDTMNVKNTGESLSTVTEGCLLPGNVGNSSFQVSRPSATIVKPRRKLLVLDVNGLLVDVVAYYPARFKPDFKLANKGVFKRPFCDDFLRFCFKKFDVGIWSSRTKENLDKAINFLMRNTKHRLLFCWHQSHCTNTGYKTLENREKPLVLKELKKLWENKNNDLPWQRGYFSESNTVLLDDSPYKALLNPPYTAVHTVPYTYQHVGDKALGPDGEIRLYLERLAEAEDVQQFIQANPFGQRPITKEHCSWKFYSKIAATYANLQDTRN